MTSDDGYRTFRLRQHGNHSLPLPPLLDRKIIAAKERFTVTKPREHAEERTQFQKQLAANVFAQALASPVRQCHLTRVRLPVHFLQAFTAHITSASESDADTALTGTARPSGRPITINVTPRPRHAFPSHTILPTSTYVLSTRPMIEYIGKKRTWGRLVDQRMQEQYARRIWRRDARKIDVSREWTWDAGMPEVVLAQLREEVARLLEAAVEAYAGGEGEADCKKGLVGPIPYEGARETVAAVLVRSSAQVPDLSSLEDSELATLLKRGPVYALQDLLDLEAYKMLSEKMDLCITDSKWAVFAHGDGRSMPLLLALHRLQIYIGRDLQADSDNSGRGLKI